MIGVAVPPADVAMAAELFELFKTPWEPARRGRKYGLVLSTGHDLEGMEGDLFILFGSDEQRVDREAGVSVERVADGADVEWRGSRWPLYEGAVVFGAGAAAGSLKARGKPLEYCFQSEGRTIRRIGYDLLGEVRHLLTQGQPASQALVPTLERHLAWLRRALLDAAIPFVEVLPRPAGFDFTCCLTHDVDFFGIRRHRFDRTLAGFVVRASVGSLIDLVRGRRVLSETFRNWLALGSLPFVFLGLIRDPWRPFADYARVEDCRRSTFFLIPFRGQPGIGPDGIVDRNRAAPYGIREVAEDATKAIARGSELGVHGIDAWRDANAGRSELEELRSITKKKTAGIRMHWLYFSADSPQVLEAAGFDYDSTWGYNEAVGYRAGTSQAMRLPGASTLIELPLSIMDSALFFATRMGLTRDEAWGRCRQILDNAKEYGGTLVINWHERSLAPERLWGRFYDELLREIETESRAWFVSAGEAVEWFRWRRSIGFQSTTSREDARIRVAAPFSSSPGGVIRVHRPRPHGNETEDVIFDGRVPVEIEV